MARRNPKSIRANADLQLELAREEYGYNFPYVNRDSDHPIYPIELDADYGWLLYLQDDGSAWIAVPIREREGGLAIAVPSDCPHPTGTPHHICRVKIRIDAESTDPGPEDISIAFCSSKMFPILSL